MTADGAAICGPVTARNEDVTDVPSKGLLPQLIDVLHALTEGQELLSLKVRDARLEHSRHMIPVIEGRSQTAHSDLAGSRTFVSTNHTATIGIRQDQPPTETAELGAGPTSANGFGNGSLPRPIIGVSPAPVSVTVPEAVAPPPNPPAAIVTHAGTGGDLSSETSVWTDRFIDPARPSEATMASLNHDYNFFDELDSRLADLQGPADLHEPGDRSEG
jgi:hypothetical protein